MEQVSITAKRRWPRFRLRTLLLAVAVLGLVFGGVAAFPRVIWRYRVAQALKVARSAGPEPSWSYSSIGARRDELSYLLSDRERVVESLLRTVEDDPDEPRRIHAAQTMRAILRQRGPSDLRERCLDRAIGLVTLAPLSPTVERELAVAITEWSASTGLDSRQRFAIMARARGASPALLPAWAGVLIWIGGREETLFVISLGDSRDPALLDAVHNSSLANSRWPGLLPALKRWLDDPAIAPRVLRYFLLSHSPEGRDLLLAYAASDRHPVELRRRAIERLQKTVSGVHLLSKAVATSKTLGACFEGDPRMTLRSALAKLDEQNGQAFWSMLIDDLESSYPNTFPKPSTAIEKAVSEAEGRIRKSRRESSLRCLRWLTGRADLQSQNDWQRWYVSTGPSPITQRELAALVLDHSEALDTTAIARRIVPYHLGELPADCVPLYERMAREGPSASRYWACTALLLFTPRSETAPIMINLIGEGQTNAAGREDRWPIELLKLRFAENYFWDVTGWREWWTEHGGEP